MFLISLEGHIGGEKMIAKEVDGLKTIKAERADCSAFACSTGRLLLGSCSWLNSRLINFDVI